MSFPASFIGCNLMSCFQHRQKNIIPPNLLSAIIIIGFLKLIISSSLINLQRWIWSFNGVFHNFHVFIMAMCLCWFVMLTRSLILV